MDKYVLVGTKMLRTGFTTGSACTAAAKAAAFMLLKNEQIDKIEINTPSGKTLALPLCDIDRNALYVKCACVKDAGDDPDVTNGLKFFATARVVSGETVIVKAGEGIGLVTKPGLKVKPGNPAINPVPMEMIISQTSKVIRQYGQHLKPHETIEITLDVPDGVETAKKTYNERLGILGGLSILGTTGIVMPMSEEAWKDSLKLELSVMRAESPDDICLVFGRIGEAFAINHLKIPAHRVMTMSNFVGFMLMEARSLHIKRLLVIGHLGKLIKVAAGNFHTHSRVSDARMEALCAYAAIHGADLATVTEILNANTTTRAQEILIEHHLHPVFLYIANRAKMKMEQYVYQEIEIDVLLIDDSNKILAATTSQKE